MKKILYLLIVCCLPIFASKQMPADLQLIQNFLDEGPRIKSLQSPTEYLAYPIGSFHSNPHHVVNYFKYLAQNSNRIKLIQYGLTHEKRPLIIGIISSEENIKNLEEILAEHQKLSDSPEKIKHRQAKTLPLINSLNYSVHGNEASGTEASLLLAYHLATGNSKAVKEILKNQIILIDPSLNPDGRARFSQWVNANRGKHAQSDVNHRELKEPWPNGRTNHYWFDLNRDWIFAAQPESFTRMKQFHIWRPHLVLDIHEMGSNSTYFFQPGHPKRNHPRTPKQVQQLTEKLAISYQKGLDSIGQSYFSKEDFDDYYYGKGSTFSDIQGAVGILFEQGSSRGLIRQTSSGTLTYAKSIYNQLIASLAHLNGAQVNKSAIQEYYLNFFKNAPGIAKKSPFKAYVFSSKTNPQAAHKLIEILKLHRIQVFHLPKDIKAKNKIFAAADSFYIPLQQSQVRFIQAIFETQNTFEDEIFYDVSSFHLPSHLGLSVVGTSRNFKKKALKPVHIDKKAKIFGSAQPIHYLLEAHQAHSFELVQHLMEQGIKVAVLSKNTQLLTDKKSKTFAAGSFLIPLHQRDSASYSPERIKTIINRFIQDKALNLYGIGSSHTLSGPNLGSRSVRFISLPKIGILVGQGVQANSAGYHWHFLDQIQNLDVILIEKQGLKLADLESINTLILPKGRYDKKMATLLKKWVHKGGHLITIETASKWAIENSFIKASLKPSFKVPSDTDFAALSQTKGAQVIGGAHFKNILDNSHPLAFGYPESYISFKQNNFFIQAIDTAGIVVGKYASNPSISGYISAENLKLMKNSSSLVATRSQKGHLTLFNDSPAFRGIGYSGHRLLLNAIFLRELYQ